MTQDRKPDTAADKDFYYTEECGLALMVNRRTGQKLGLDKDLWTDVVSAIKTEAHPGATAKDA
ncbi:MAG: hypothetical protein AAF376_17535 [Pseudomonadota bacterium]